MQIILLLIMLIQRKEAVITQHRVVSALAVMTCVSDSAGGVTALLLIWPSTDAGRLLIPTAVVFSHQGVYYVHWRPYAVVLRRNMVQKLMLV